MFKQWNRRRVYADFGFFGYDPFTGRNVKRIKGKTSAAFQPPMSKRSWIFGAKFPPTIEAANLAGAAQAYLELMAIDPQQILPRQQMLDVANQLMLAGQWVDSAYAYEKFMKHYSNYEHAEQVQLMLGILYSRYLNEPATAVKYLESAVGRLTDAGQLKMCKDELARLG